MNRILVTGSRGLVGTSFMIEAAIPTPSIFNNLTQARHEQYDLTDPVDTCTMFREAMPDIVIHLAGKVGGVKANTSKMADFFTENILINTNVLRTAQKFGVKKLISLMSTCIFPDNVRCGWPIVESDLHNGAPHDSNYGYAYAKRMLDIQSRAYRQQYGCNFVTLIPNNIYGAWDNFHLEDSHVIPALIRKIYEAKIADRDVTLWGDGKAFRQFSYAPDIAQVILWAIDNYHDASPLNIGNSREYTIRRVADMIANKLGFEGRILWDTSQPSGQDRKTTSFDKLAQTGCSVKWTSLEKGLDNVCWWFQKEYPDIRGINK